MRALIFISFLFIHPYLFSQVIKKTTFEEISADNSNRRFDSILIIGAGSTATRIFLDDLVTQLVEKLDSKNVVTTYMYLGKKNEMLNEFLDTFKNAGYKVIMVFQPKEQAFLYTKKRRSINFVQLGDRSIVSSARQDKLNYEGEFIIVLYENNQKKRDFWKASLKVRNDPSKSRSAKKISNWILSSFTKNNYL
jgi:hypothetical protein